MNILIIKVVILFLHANGKIIEKERTLSENGIKNGDTIILNQNEL